MGCMVEHKPVSVHTRKLRCFSTRAIPTPLEAAAVGETFFGTLLTQIPLFLFTCYSVVIDVNTTASLMILCSYDLFWAILLFSDI
jgi:hypothetical protein